MELKLKKKKTEGKEDSTMSKRDNLKKAREARIPVRSYADSPAGHYADVANRAHKNLQKCYERIKKWGANNTDDIQLLGTATATISAAIESLGSASSVFTVLAEKEFKPDVKRGSQRFIFAAKQHVWLKPEIYQQCLGDGFTADQLEKLYISAWSQPEHQKQVILRMDSPDQGGMCGLFYQKDFLPDRPDYEAAAAQPTEEVADDESTETVVNEAVGS